MGCFLILYLTSCYAEIVLEVVDGFFRADAIGHSNPRGVVTPNADLLAKESASFQNAYCQNQVCMHNLCYLTW